MRSDPWVPSADGLGEWLAKHGPEPGHLDPFRRQNKGGTPESVRLGPGAECSLRISTSCAHERSRFRSCLTTVQALSTTQAIYRIRYLFANSVLRGKAAILNSTCVYFEDLRQQCMEFDTSRSSANHAAYRSACRTSSRSRYGISEDLFNSMTGARIAGPNSHVRSLQ